MAAPARRPGRGLLPTAEPYGLEPVPDAERNARGRDLFWVWFSANLAFTYVILGAGLWGYGLGALQVLAVTALGAASYLLVGAIALPGARHGVPTMALGAYVLGRRGNAAASLLSWLNLVGWESVVLVISAQALATALRTVTGWPAGAGLSLAGLALTVVLVFGTAFLGYRAVVRVQSVLGYVFGALTALGLVLALSSPVALSRLWAHPSGPWLTGALPAFALVASATGLSWVNTGADYSRYLARTGRGVVHATAWGGWVPATALILAGAALAVRAPALGAATNPVAALERLVPAWFAAAYLVTAAAGMIAGDILDVYSGGLSLLAAGVHLPRSRTVLADLVVSLAVAAYTLSGRLVFLPLFESFLTLVASALAPWAAVYLASLRRLSDPALLDRPPPVLDTGRLAAWLAGMLAAALTAWTPLWSGPLARGPFSGSALGLVLGFAVSFALALAWPGSAPSGTAGQDERR
jgi:NCS1 family nucleobase:cation symporter-1